PEEQELFNKHVVPLKAAIRKLYSRAYGIPEDSLRYGVNRQVKGKGSTVDRIMDQMSRALPWRRSLPKSASALKRRTMMALEGPDGKRTVVHLGDGEIVAATPSGPKLIARYKRRPGEGATMLGKDGRHYTLREAMTHE